MKHQLAQYGKYTIYVVDGSEVRDSSKKNEDFGGSAIHIDFPKLIPENEIWIEDGVEEDERRFLIANALKRLQLLAKGYSKELSYDLALRTERDIRRNSRTDAHNGTVKVSQYYEFEGLKVYLVRGMVVPDDWWSQAAMARGRLKPA